MASEKDICVGSHAYSILGLSPNCTQDEIRTAYKKLILKLHPDKGGKDLEAFYKVQAAYHVLSEPEKRAKYDAIGEKQKKSVLERIMVSIKKYAPSVFQDIRDILIEEVFLPSASKVPKLTYTTEAASSIVTSLDLTKSIQVGLHDIYKNIGKKITVTRDINGTIETKEYIIPLLNSRVVIPGGGHVRDAKRGDVHIHIKCEKHPNFHKRDYDLILHDKLSLYELFAGFERRYLMPDGSVVPIVSPHPCKEYHFDGDHILITVPNKGLPMDIQSNAARGLLMIILTLDKPKDLSRLKFIN